MKLHKLNLKEIRNFIELEINFSQTTAINTISGKNGSGKTSIFRCIQLSQQCFFTNELKNPDLVYKNIGVELSKLFNSKNSTIEIFFLIEKDGKPKEVSFKIIAKEYNIDFVTWEIIGKSDDLQEIRSSWNIKTPRDLIIYVPSDKHLLKKMYRMKILQSTPPINIIN